MFYESNSKELVVLINDSRTIECPKWIQNENGSVSEVAAIKIKKRKNKKIIICLTKSCARGSYF